MNGVPGKFKLINSVACLAGTLGLVMIASTVVLGSTQKPAHGYKNSNYSFDGMFTNGNTVDGNNRVA